MHEMKDSGIEWIGYIPSNWELKRIQFSLEEINIKNTPIKTKNVLSLVKDKGVMLYEEKGNKGNKSKNDVSEYKLAYENTLIVNSMNVLIGSVGISKYFGCVSPVYYVFKENVNSDLRFINYIFNTREFQKQLRKYANGILEIRLRVSSYDIFKQKIALPQKSVQNKIADFLDKKCTEIDSLSEDIQKEIDLLEEYKKSVISEAVTKGLNPNVEMKDTGLCDIGKIPNNWCVKKLKYVTKKIFKGSGIKKDDVTENGDLGCVRYGEIYTKYNNTICTPISRIKSNILKSSQPFLEKGDILFTSTGELIEEIGKNVIYESSEKCAVGGDIIVARSNVNSKFLNYALDSGYCRAQKSCNKFKLKVVHIYASEIANLRIVLPPPLEQEHISSYLDSKCDEIDKTILEKRQQIETLEDYKKSIIYEYVTGKKEVI